MKKTPIQFQSFNQIEKRKWLIIVVLVAAVHLFCQTLMLPYGTALLSLLPDHENTSYSTQISNSETLEDELQEERFEVFEEVALDEIINDTSAQNQLENDRFVTDDLRETRHELLSVDLSSNLEDGVSINNNVSNNEIKPKILEVNVESFTKPDVNKSGDGIQARILPINEKYALFQTDGIKKMRCLMPPKSVMYNDQMNHLLVRNRRSSRAMVCQISCIHYTNSY